MEIATWPQRHKGIDDLLLAGGTFATERHLPTELPVDVRISARFLPPLAYRGVPTTPCVPQPRGDTVLLPTYAASKSPIG